MYGRLTIKDKLKPVQKWFASLWTENRSFIIFIVLMCVFRSAVADWNEVPTGSMNPTIVEGDRIWVNKLAYDIQLPFLAMSLYQHSNPERGDIVVFNSEASDTRLVKRVIGIPGDSVELNNNILKINGQTLVYDPIKKSRIDSEKMENLLGVEHVVRIRNTGSVLSSFKQVTVPSGHYMVMGDNRDNSSDSRVIGFVPRHEIIGRSEHVVLSLNYENYYLPRTDRFFHTL